MPVAVGVGEGEGVAVKVEVGVTVGLFAACTGIVLNIPLRMARVIRVGMSIRNLKNTLFSPGENFPPYRLMLIAISFQRQDGM